KMVSCVATSSQITSVPRLAWARPPARKTSIETSSSEAGIADSGAGDWRGGSMPGGAHGHHASRGAMKAASKAVLFRFSAALERAQRVHRQALFFQPPPATQVRQVDDESALDHLPASRRDQQAGGFRRA